MQRQMAWLICPNRYSWKAFCLKWSLLCVLKDGIFSRTYDQCSERKSLHWWKRHPVCPDCCSVLQFRWVLSTYMCTSEHKIYTLSISVNLYVLKNLPNNCTNIYHSFLDVFIWTIAVYKECKRKFKMINVKMLQVIHKVKEKSHHEC